MANTPFWVIGIGASAGGLEALSDFLAQVPAQTPAVFLIAQHLAPHAKSMLVELLARHSHLPVHAAQTRMPLNSAGVYIAPPNFDIEIEQGQLNLIKAGEETRPKPSIDRLFISLAREYGNRSVGIILSGTGSDGAEGLRAIKNAGGTTIVQDKGSAKYDGMPNAALETGKVDAILPPGEIARRLPDLLAAAEDQSEVIESEAGPRLEDIVSLIRHETGTDFSRYKMTTLRRRLARRMALLGIADVGSYYDQLKDSKDELKQLAQELLVSVTSFFRDPDAWESLEEIVRKLIDDKPQGEEIRVWSAGCATGEEPYTLAMMICDHVTRAGRSNPIKVFATDLDFEAISYARTGVYPEADMQAIPKEYLQRYTERRAQGFEIRKNIREMVVFARQDLIQNPPFVKLDLVSCRNVLIYFQADLQKKIFEIFHYALAPGRYLFLGKSENVSSTDLFEVLDKKTKLFVRREVAQRVIPPNVRANTPTLDISAHRRRSNPLPSLMESAQLQLLRQHGISGAVVNDQGQIQTILGEVQPYLKLQAGLSEFRLQNMLPQSAAVEMNVLLHKVASTRTVQKSRLIRFDQAFDTGGSAGFHILVSPLDTREEANALSPSLFLVSFEKLSPAVETVVTAVDPSSEYATRVSELEQEVAVTREHLQTVIEELGVSNEELQSVNEELSSTNEELQASNEELETTNEELQSTNEELTTLNEELNIKSSELRSSNVALENVQNSFNSPLLVVDNELRLTRYNAVTNELFDVTSSDIGRPVTRVSCRCEIPNFEQTLREVVRTGEVREQTVQAFRSFYQMRTMPCRDDVGRIVGATIVFFNSTDLVQTENKWRQSENRIRSIIDGANALIFLKDAMGRYLTANQAFSSQFGLEEKDILGKTDREIFGDVLANQLRGIDLEALLRRQKIERQETFPVKGQTRTFFTSRFPLYEQDGNAFAVGTVAFDITDKVVAEERLRTSENLYRTIVQDQSVLIARLLPDGQITFGNDAFVQYFDGIYDPAVPKSFEDLTDLADRVRIRKDFDRLLKGNSPSVVEHRVIRQGAGRSWVRWIAKAVTGENDARELQMVGFDVTEYRAQIDQMVQRDVLFSHIFNYTADFLSVFRVNRTGDIVLESFNRSTDRGGGISYAQYLGRNIKELLDARTADVILAKYQECVKTRRPQSFDEELSLPGGIQFLTTTIIPVVNEDGQVERVVALSRDISRFKRTELELTRARDAAEVASQAKSDFLASMSHELRTPLNVVLGMAQLLEDAKLSTDERRQLESIQRSGKVLLNLIEDVLDISKIEAGKIKLEFAPFDFGEFIAESIEPFGIQTTQKKIALVTKNELPPGAKFIGDVHRVRQILVNLVANAIKFTDQGSVTVHVSARAGAAENRRLLRFEIRDTGIGIPEEFHNRIFQKFSQVETGLARRYGGTGLGLVICKRLVTLMQGNIGFESEWGKGSTFWFEIPLVITTGLEKTRTPAHSDAPRASSDLQARILAVDDSADGQVVLRLFLKRMGHDADFADSGQMALEKLRESHFDLVLMDIQMPGMDGYQTTAEIRKMTNVSADLPVVALTANAMVGDSERCFDAGMNDYLTKPIEFDKLRNLIEKWVLASRAARTEAEGT